MFLQMQYIIQFDLLYVVYLCLRCLRSDRLSLQFATISVVAHYWGSFRWLWKKTTAAANNRKYRQNETIQGRDSNFFQSNLKYLLKYTEILS